MNIVRVSYSFLFFVFVVAISCNSQEADTKKRDKEIVDTLLVEKKATDSLIHSQQLKFKKWLRDTIPKIKTIGKFKERQIVLRDDSLLIQIMDKYELNVDSRFKSTVDDINYALDLLDRNNDRPKKRFHLDFWVNNYYLPSMFPQFDHEYEYDVDKFIITTNDSTIDYTFIKGNLTGRKAKVNNLKKD